MTEEVHNMLRAAWHLLPIFIVCIIMFGGAYAAFRKRFGGAYAAFRERN